MQKIWVVITTPNGAGRPAEFDWFWTQEAGEMAFVDEVDAVIDSNVVLVETSTVATDTTAITAFVQEYLPEIGEGKGFSVVLADNDTALVPA